jgi:indole-3-glycerol phosphate synthase
MNFVESIRRASPLAIIAEIKRASPSRGVINQEIDATRQAQAYVQGGATAVSVLTESRWFRGQIDDLRAVRNSIKAPLLRKDFLIEDEDIALSRKIGADAVLLIVACLPSARLAELIQYSHRLDMTPLVEVHDRSELDVALSAGAHVIGVNSRNLRTLTVEKDIARDVLAHVPSACIRVFESGIHGIEELRAARDAGADAVLVGETFMRAHDPAVLIQSWIRDLPQSQMEKQKS